MTNIAFIEDSSLYLKTLVESIQMQPDLNCLLAAHSVEEFYEKLPLRARLNIIFVDINLPGQSGIDALPGLHSRFPQAELIVLTQQEEPSLLFKAIVAGATGYLIKNFSLMQFPNLIQDLLKGGALISPKMARYLVDYFNPAAQSPADKPLLSAKEMSILTLFSDGHSYQETASLLDISVDGIKYFAKKIYRKLGVNTKIEAINAIKE